MKFKIEGSFVLNQEETFDKIKKIILNSDNRFTLNISSDENILKNLQPRNDFFCCNDIENIRIWLSVKGVEIYVPYGYRSGGEMYDLPLTFKDKFTFLSNCDLVQEGSEEISELAWDNIGMFLGTKLGSFERKIIRK